MGYKVLVTLDLPGATEKQRDVFYEVLKKKYWKKIENLTTTWKVSFADDVNRVTAITILQRHQQIAKDDNKVKKVEYAMQLDLSEVIINHI